MPIIGISSSIGVFFSCETETSMNSSCYLG
jgi:hypothetical protein